MLSAGIQSVTVALPLSGGGAALVGSPYHPTSEAEAEVEVVVRFDGEGGGPPIALPFNMGGLWRELITLQGGELVFLVPEHEPGKPAPTFSTLVGATKAKPVALLSCEHAAQFASVALADGRLLLTGGACDGAPTVETQLLDPKTAAWTPGTPLPRPRTGRVAAQAPDGRVLLVGGVGVDWLGREAPLAEVDVLVLQYAPDHAPALLREWPTQGSGRSQALSTLAVARLRRTAKPLPDLLIVEGYGAFPALP